MAHTFRKKITPRDFGIEILERYITVDRVLK